MSESNSGSRSGGIGFTELLAILFIALKLTGVIHWSWWWVLSPLWLGVALAIALVASFGTLAYVVERRELSAQRKRVAASIREREVREGRRLQ